MIFNHQIARRHVGCSIAVWTVVAWLFSTAAADEECATDFFSHKTCRLFDTMTPDAERPHDSAKSAEGVVLLKDDSGLLGSQIRYRNRLDGNWMLMMPSGQKTSGNVAIHGWRCMVDLFGKVICDRSQSNIEVFSDETLNN